MIKQAFSTTNYRSFLDPNGWEIGENDYIIEGFFKEKRAGTSSASRAMPNLKDGSTIWILPDAINGATNLDIANGGIPWHVKDLKVRIIPTQQLTVKGSPDSSYAPLRLFGSERFDVDLRSVQFPAKDLTDLSQFPINVDSDGILSGMTVQFDVEGLNPHIKLSGLAAGGGSFAALRALESARHRIVSGEMVNIYLHNTKSECAYIGSIRPMHAKFKNFRIANWLMMNAGSEAIQALNFGEGSVIEDISIVNTGTEWPSPFQNYQRGTFQFKAGGGNVKIQRIYAMGHGAPAIGIFSSGDYTDPMTGETYSGVNPGDKIDISDLYFSHGNGQLIHVDKSNTRGAEWIFNNIHMGDARKRMESDVGEKLPYAFLSDVFGATDKVTFKSITTDDSLPLVGKYGKYDIVEHKLVDKVVTPKFQNPPFPEGQHVLAYYHTYNQVSQRQFYPIAGQPVKYWKNDIVYYDVSGQPRTWFKSLRDQYGAPGAPGEGWAPIDPPKPTFTQAQDSPLIGKAGFIQEVVIPVIDQVKKELAELISRFVLEANEIMNKLK